MRKMPILLAAALIAAPACAEAPRPVTPPVSSVQSVLADPATADKLARVMQGLSKAFLNLPVGEVQAAIEGRPATASDRARTVGQLSRERDPNFERDLDRQLADSGAVVRSGMKAMATALPAMTNAVTEMSREMERAMANLPRPNYPKR